MNYGIQHDINELMRNIMSTGLELATDAALL